MVEILIIALGIILLSRIIEDKFSIPITLTLILSTFFIVFLYPGLFALEDKEFDNILYMMLPIILLPDVLSLSINELEKNAKMFFTLAFVVVVFSIALAVGISYAIGTSYNLSIGALVLLFTILMATDAITVSSIFSKFQLPHQLKIYAEGESLFNDVTALILFYFVALPLLSGEVVSILQVNLVIFKVVFLSILVGLFCAVLGFIGMKLCNDVIEQFIVVYMVVISSFIIAEHFHIAGILSIVVSILAFKYLLHNDLKKKDFVSDETLSEKMGYVQIIRSKFNRMESLSKRDYRTYKKSAYFIGIFANAFVFIAMVATINIKLLMEVKNEIVFVFVLTTFIRFIFMTGVFKYKRYPYRWSNTLTLAGAKGGLAVIMAHSIPYDFVYRDQFISIVNGVVLISIFVYTIILIYYINKNKENFLMDGGIYKEQPEYNKQELEMLSIGPLKKDPLTNAYLDSFIEDKIANEIKNIVGHHKNLSIVVVKLENLTRFRRKNEKQFILDRFGATVNEQILSGFCFGKFTDDTYVISMNADVEEALAWSKELYTHVTDSFSSSAIDLDLNFGIAQAESGDSYDMLLEKAEDGLEDEHKFRVEF